MISSILFILVTFSNQNTLQELIQKIASLDNSEYLIGLLYKDSCQLVLELCRCMFF